MKIARYILTSLIAAAAATGLYSCDNEFDYPPVSIPDNGSLGEGTPDVPLTVNGVKGYYTAYYSDAPDTGTYYWATGYIVGCVVTTDTDFTANVRTSVFEAPFGSVSNILLASDPEETDYSKCIALQLPSGNVRSSLNLSDNPSNKGRLVTVHGYIDKYLGIPGMRSVDGFNWGSEGIPGMEPTLFHKVSSITSGKGYAIAVNNSGSWSVARPADAGANYGWLYVAGVTPSGDVIKSDAANAFMFTESPTPGQYYILDSYGRYLYMEGSFNSFQLSTTLNASNANYLWQPVANADGTWNITNVGNSKVVQYYIEKSSFGAYPTIQDGYLLPQLYELDGEMTLPDNPGGGDEPAPGPDPVEGAIYSALGASEATLSAGWEFDNVSMTGDLTYVWSWKEYNGNHYLNGSSHLGSANAAEAYAISPVISLEGATGCSVSFDHAARFQTNLRRDCGLMVRLEGATDWTSLTIPQWPEAGAWKFANSGDISLAAYDGKKIQLAFKYVGTASEADTWEIQNLVIKGTK